MNLLLIPSVIRIEIPSLDRLIDFLRERENVQKQLDELTARLKQANTNVETAVNQSPKE